MTQTIQIKPVAKPRMTQRDKWNPRKCVTTYWAFKDELNLKFKGSVADQYKLTFIIPMPKSWSKKKKREMNLRPHQQKPDKDNLEKAFLDALIHKPDDDSRVWDGHVKKLWGYDGEIYYEEL